MSQTKKRILIITLCVLFVFLYIIFAFRFSGEELQLETKWTTSITKRNQVPLTTENKKQFPFKLGQNLGYFTSDGEIVLTESFPYMATISNDYWSVFTSSAENIPVFDKAKNQVGQIQSVGFPYFSQFGNFIFLPGGMAFSALSQDGEVLWSYEDVTPITSFYPYENGVIVGFVEGKIINFDKNGKILSAITPGGSNYSVILGGAASSDGSVSACVSGLDSQRFIVMKTTDQQTKTIFHEYLEGNLREQTFVKFSKNNQKIFFNEKNGLGVFSLEELELFHMPLDGKILAVEEMEDLNLTFVLTKLENKYNVYILEGLNNLVGYYSFNANNGFILVDENNLYTGADTTITKTEVKK